MTTPNDWDAALDAAIAAERERLGGPPSPEEVVAYTRGELSEPDRARVRALLVYYPELSELLDEVPSEAARSTPPAVIAGETTLAAPTPIVRGWLRSSLSIAATAVLIPALTVALVASRWQLSQQIRAGAEPYVHQTRHQLDAFRTRGGARPYPLPAGETHYLLVAPLPGAAEYPAYRLTITDVTGRTPKIVWTSEGVQPIRKAFELSVPARFLRPGQYRLEIHGPPGAPAAPVDSFLFTMPERQ
ncbi:MAG TPA: hypothetical protein VGF69_03290 [Thermoanaerobaculia bacterium]|jgi:hypothetical protein